MKAIRVVLFILISALVFGCEGLPTPGPDGSSGCDTAPTPTPTPPPQQPDPTPAQARLTGRFDMSDAAGPKASWSASTIKANFEGTAIAINLKSSGDNWFNVIIDGFMQAPVNITPNTAQPVPLASNLLYDSPHSIEIVKRTEGYQGEMQFLGFTFPQGGSLLAQPAAAARRIEFIGDSITCGYGNEGENQYQTYTPKNENAYLAYGAITARLLGADQITVAAGGKGVLRNYDGSTTDVMPDLYPRTVIWNPNLLWDYTAWIPHVVVINLGTNDYNAGIPDPGRFTAAYAGLVNTVRRQYADAMIYCALGPMLWGDNLADARHNISSVIEQLRTAGDTKVKFIEFPMQTAENGYGEDWHPNLKTHERMANQLAERIKTDLGW